MTTWTLRRVVITAGTATGATTHEFERNTPFVEAVESVAEQHDWTHFIVRVGGREISPADAPKTVGDADGAIEVAPYQVAG
ncbi:MAG: hypothetical protein RMN24_00685 [Anaerolineae bacterium]|nr:hypothetical protein [Anaerolineae bacterium]